MNPIVPCPVCKRPTRPFKTTRHEMPGTIARAKGDATCVTCYKTGRTAAPADEKRTLRRPTRETRVTLCRWFGKRALLMTGGFVRITPDYYTLRIDGEELDFDRFHWEEVIEHD